MTTRSRIGAVGAGVTMFLAAGLLAAQAWRGQADLEVRVSSRKGGNVSGARVELMYRDGRGDQGPPPVATDGRGRAIIQGLAAGTWQVEVKHPNHMSFVAVVRLDPKERPQITASFLEATADSASPIQVKLLKSKGGTASAPLRVAEAPPPAATPEPQVPAQAKAAEALPQQPVCPAPQAAPKSATTEEVAPAAQPTPNPTAPAPIEPAPTESRQAEPAPAEPRQTAPTPTVPEPRPAQPATPVLSEPSVDSNADAEQPMAEAPIPPMPEPTVEQDSESVPEAAAPVELPEPEVAVAPEQLPVADPVPTPQPKPAQPEIHEAAPAMESPAVEVPATEPVPQPTMPDVEPQAAREVSMPEPEPTPAAAPVAPPPAAEWRSYQNRTCPECRPGEWAVTAAVRLSAGSACSEAAVDSGVAAARFFGGQAALELSGFAGDLNQALSAIDAGATDSASQHLAAARADGCGLLAITLPKSGRFVGFQYEHEGASGRQPCLPDQPCPGGGATFSGPPRITRGAAVTVINTSAFGDKGLALMTVFFRAPNDQWSP